jgi:hypothetical protein
MATTNDYTVRKMSDNIGVERIFPMNSPFIENIVLNSEGKFSSYKLYYLRNIARESCPHKKKMYKSKNIQRFINAPMQIVGRLSYICRGLFFRKRYAVIKHVVVVLGNFAI